MNIDCNLVKERGRRKGKSGHTKVWLDKALTYQNQGVVKRLAGWGSWRNLGAVTEPAYL